jgi:glucose/arabinose dehydrogenase
VAENGIVRSSGGAQTSSNPSSSRDDTDSDDPPASVRTPEPEAAITGAVDTKPTESDATEGSGQNARRSTAQQLSRTDSTPVRDAALRPVTTASTETANDERQLAVEIETSNVDVMREVAKLDVAPPTDTTSSAVTTLVDSQPTNDPAAQDNTTTPIVTSVLAAIGLGPLATTDPMAPAAPAPSLLDVLVLAWREFNRTFFNQTPTLAYNPAENSLVEGKFVGKFTAADPDGAGVVVTATKPAHGAVEIGPDGTFTYTPDATFYGQDSFQITATEVEDGFHIHGFSGLLNLLTFGLIGDSGHSATATVTVGGHTISTVVSGLNEPTDFRFLPDGRILLAEKGGAIRVADQHGQLQSTPLITLPTATTWARGLAALEVDPDYAENGHIYVSYIGSDNYQRLSRLTVTDPGAEVLTVNPESELVLVKGTDPAGEDHHGGGLAFGPDGKLYWSVGDNVCCSVLDGRNSQDLSNIYGKVLRLNPDGSAPSDNPFPSASGAGPLIYATGFRNPFRLAFTPDGQLMVVDVGQATWEEVNLVTAGSNYGWPHAEGPCDGIGAPSCSTPSAYENPIYAYRHTNGPSSITAVMSVAGSGSGGGQNTVLIADFMEGWVKELTFNSDYSELTSERMFDNAATGNTNQLIQHADGSIYQLTFDGTLTRIAPLSAVPSSV